nr:putative reverse transcriptase domain-containing protein [Tanacetum cinerariifolium]
MTIGLNIPKQILEAQIEAQKPENFKKEDVGGMVRKDIPKEKLEPRVDRTLCLNVEFSYNNSYHASIKGAPLEALYSQKCRSHVCWAEVGEAQLIGPKLVQETAEMIIQIKQRIQVARDRQKSYVEIKRKSMEFQVGDRVMLKVLPWKGVVRFGKRGKLNPRYVRPLKKCYADEPLAILLDGLHVDDKLHFIEEPVEIID